MRSDEYWAQRKAREMYQMLVPVEETAKELTKEYARASLEVEQEARRLVRKFQRKFRLTEKDAYRLLDTAISPDDIKSITMALKGDPKNEEFAVMLESQAYRARLKRLEATQANVDTLTAGILTACRGAFDKELKKIARGAYYREIFAMQQQADAMFTFNPLDEKLVTNIINRRWSGQSYSQRLWDNSQALAESVKSELVQGILTGKTEHKMTQAIQQRFMSGASQTRRLIRTEANYTANQTILESYKSCGIDRYIFCAVLDLRTSETCREHDGKTYLVSSATPGVNLPPLHPWCRSTTIAWMPDSVRAKQQRQAIDPATGEKIKVPANWTYEDWYREYGSKAPKDRKIPVQAFIQVKPMTFEQADSGAVNPDWPDKQGT